MSIVFKRTSGILIPTEYKNEKFYEFIKSKLTRRVKNFNDPTYTVNKYYIEGEKFLKIPRYFPIWEYVDCRIEDKLPEGEDIEIESKITLRDELQRNTVEYMLTHDNGILKCSPGSGKTVISIHVVCQLKKKTFILCHRTELVNQWTGFECGEKPHGFLTYTNIKEDEIGILSSKNYKEVLKKKIIVCTDQTFTSLLRRNRQEFLIELNKSNISVMIADEIHTSIGAPTFSECSLHMPVKKIFGLSATPNRTDGTDNIIQYHLGPIYVPEGTSSTMNTRVTVLFFDFEIIKGREKYMYWEGKFQRSRYLNLIKNSKPFMGIIIGLLNKFVDDQRNIICVAERIKLIDKLFDEIKTDNKAKFISGSSSENLNKQVVLLTPGRGRDGLDIPKKDCLLMTSPISNITQMIGRVIRQSKNKKEPITVDLVDIGCKEISKTLFDRIEFYNEKKWSIKFIYINDKGEKTELDQIQVLKLLQENQ